MTNIQSGGSSKSIGLNSNAGSNKNGSNALGNENGDIIEEEDELKSEKAESSVSMNTQSEESSEPEDFVIK